MKYLKNIVLAGTLALGIGYETAYAGHAYKPGAPVEYTGKQAAKRPLKSRRTAPMIGKLAPSLKGSKASQLRQNEVADRYDLTRIDDASMLLRFEKSGRLVRLCNPPSYCYVDSRLPYELGYARPWTKRFVDDLSRAYYSAFRDRLKVTSAVRTEEYQNALRKRNGNAAKTNGPTASSHTTGSTVDITKSGMSSKQKIWMRNNLRQYERLGVAEATEEYRQSVFHIMAFPNYVQPRKPATSKRKR